MKEEYKLILKMGRGDNYKRLEANSFNTDDYNFASCQMLGTLPFNPPSHFEVYEDRIKDPERVEYGKLKEKFERVEYERLKEKFEKR